MHETSGAGSMKTRRSLRVLPFAVALVAALAAPGAVSLAAQPPPGQGRPPAGQQPDVVSPGEIQRMFDAYALMQAQDQLKISDEQYGRFLTRFKALQDARRRGQQERLRLIADLRRLLQSGEADDAVLKDRVKALSDLDARTADEIRKAFDAVDEVLTVHQQAQFRVFEENMERRKLELLMRARQANRPKNQP